MTNPIILPKSAFPSNLNIPEDVHLDSVDSDTFNICERIKRELEGGDRLIITLMRRGDQHVFLITEDCDDGVNRLVLKTKELDDRVIQKLYKMRALPLDKRLVAIEESIKAEEAAEEENEMERLYENMGRPMWTQLEKDGFIDGRGVSFPKAGPKRAKYKALRS